MILSCSLRSTRRILSNFNQRPSVKQISTLRNQLFHFMMFLVFCERNGDCFLQTLSQGNNSPMTTAPLSEKLCQDPQFKTTYHAYFRNVHVLTFIAEQFDKMAFHLLQSVCIIFCSGLATKNNPKKNPKETRTQKTTTIISIFHIGKPTPSPCQLF